MIEQYIGFGKWSKFYNYILFLIIVSVSGDISERNCEVLNYNGITKNIYKYCGNILFGFIFLIILKIRLNKIGTNRDLIKRPKNPKDVKLIYDDNRSSFAMGNIDVIFFLIICLIYVVNSEIAKVLRYINLYNLDLWTADIFFILILMYYYFPQYTYKHRIISMLFIAIINTFLLILATFCKAYRKNEDENYQNIYKYKGISICIFCFFIYTFTAFLIFFGRVYGKILMEKHFISPYKIIIFVGVFGLIINLIIALIFKNKSKNLDCENNDKKRFPNFYCYLDVNNYFSVLSDIKYREIILTITYIICSFLSLMCELFVIKYLNPNFLLMSDNIRYIVQNIMDFYKEENHQQLLLKFLIIIFSDIFEFLGCLIYVELIELRFCGLNLNLKRKIMERSETEGKTEELFEIQNNDNDIDNDNDNQHVSIINESNIE